MNAPTMRVLRRYHLYIGVFFAPMLLLFALSGAVQVFRLHEAGGWGGNSPPYWLAWIGAIHKNQALPRPERATSAPSTAPATAHEPAEHDGGGAGSKAGNHADAEHAARPSGTDHASGKPAGKPSAGKRSSRSFALEVFTAWMGIGLILSTLLGITIALNNRATRRISVVMLALGTLLPLAFLYL